MDYNFDDIRPYSDAETAQAIKDLLKDEEFEKFREKLMPDISREKFAQICQSCNQTRDAFKSVVGYEAGKRILGASTFSYDASGRSRLGENRPFTYVSNHRDIIVDPLFLNVSLKNLDYRQCQIAIGDNLIKRPWIGIIVRLFGSFLVKRTPSIREKIAESTKLSAYIHHTIRDLKESVWIAQREGRAKDSDDRTQSALIKMLTMGAEGSILERIRELNIVPSTFSYEYDPCDFLKAREMQAKRENPGYKKSPQEDLINMATGVQGFKGRVHLTFGKPLNQMLGEIDPSLPNKDQIDAICKLIDKEIHSHYRIYPGNYIAADMLEESDRFSAHYGLTDRMRFEDYLKKQLEKIVFDDPTIQKDEPFLRKCILTMYANPLLNKVKATE